MTRNEFSAQLKKRLKRMPQSEIDSAVGYYEEYFEEMGVGGNDIIPAGTITPEAAAAGIIGTFAVEDKKSNNHRTLWMVILAVFASPIALPLALAVVVVALALLLVVFSLVIAIGSTGLGFGVNGVVCILAGFIGLVGYWQTGLMLLGFGLFTVPTGIYIFYGAIKLSVATVGWLKKMLGKFLLRRGAK
ncbi:MAG: DUF1700 domain-containing protein [Oscillospiraceae bacterium]|jgi:uncharacterized membrane protein|nr:DUF1700 domain-containing protein [Oscillospiraceae bacterium]